MTSKSKIYRAGIIGCGKIGSLMDAEAKRTGINTHAKAYHTHPAVQLAAGADINPYHRARFQELWNVAGVYEDYRALLKTEQLDILSICTPPSTHWEILEEAVRAGIKMIFCEKPLAQDIQAARAMVKLSVQHALVVAVNYFRRFDSFHREIGAFIQDGHLGRIQTVRCLYTKGIANNGSHLIDLMHMYFGSIDWVWANANSSDNAADPTFDGYLYFEAGFGASIQGCGEQYYRIFELDVLGTEGRLRLDSGFNMELFMPRVSTRTDDFRELSLSTPPFRNGRQGYFHAAIDNLIEAADSQAPLLCDIHDGARAVEIVENLKLSLQTGKQVHC